MENNNTQEFACFDDTMLYLLQEEQEQQLAKDPFRRFLAQWSPAEIQRALNSRVIGQPDVTAAVADFIHYHVLRQVCPQLKPRPILIAGPSGCGKTEVFRAAAELFRDSLSVQIIDGAMLSGDGWAGNYKLSDSITKEFAKGGILVVDEFDKLATPYYNTYGSNSSAPIQAQLLKLLEGELIKVDKGGINPVPTARMGIALTGAFEKIRSDREKDEAVKAEKASRRAVGFLSESAKDDSDQVPAGGYQDKDFIAFGVLPEIMGRIAVCCTARSLDAEDYRQMVLLPTSRVSNLLEVLQAQGIPVQNVISDQELDGLIAQSMQNHTGARWVSAQVERRILASLRNVHMNFFEPSFLTERESA